MDDNEKQLMGSPGFAMPVMRGFPCPVDTPIMGANSGPKNGMGVGWAQVAGHGVKFFVSLHGGNGMTLMAELDYARYKRFAELFAGAGQQAKLVGDLTITDEADPLKALAEAAVALKKAQDKFKAEKQIALANKMGEALMQCQKALGGNVA